MIEAEHHTDGLVCECVGGDLVKAPIIFEALRPDEVLIDISAFEPSPPLRMPN